MNLTGILIHCQWEYKLVQPLWKNIWQYLLKLKIHITYNPTITLLSIQPTKIYAHAHGRVDKNTLNSFMNYSQQLEKIQVPFCKRTDK